MHLDLETMTLAELKIIHDTDNECGDCDCSFCRYYRQIIRELEESRGIL